MASENESEKRETLADIVAWLRNSDGANLELICPWWADGGDCSLCPLGGRGANIGKHCIFTKIADRIGAAWKREREAVEADALSAGGLIEAMRQKRQATPTTEKYSAVGNAAVMRAALEHVEKLAREFAAGNYYVSDFPKMLLDAIRPALSAPARQCDMGTPEAQGIRCLAMMRHWRKAYQEDTLITAIMKWAQTPYAEEGDGDGR